MPSFLTASYKDRPGQRSSVRFQVRSIDAANIDAVQTEFSALRTAIDGISLANLNQYEIVADRVFVSDGNASDMAARRELKLLVTYEDDVTHKSYNHEIPAPDVTLSALWSTSDPEQPDYTHANWTAFATAFEATVVSPDGNAVTIREARIVGRNL